MALTYTRLTTLGGWWMLALVVVVLVGGELVFKKVEKCFRLRLRYSFPIYLNLHTSSIFRRNFVSMAISPSLCSCMTLSLSTTPW